MDYVIGAALGTAVAAGFWGPMFVIASIMDRRY
jgi:hypothetical protein